MSDNKAFLQQLKHEIQNLNRDDILDFKVLSPDGFCIYGCQKREILGADMIFAGMQNNAQITMFDMSDLEYVDEVINWLLEDIEVAVGENYELTF